MSEPTGSQIDKDLGDVEKDISGFGKLTPEKAAAVLPKFKANIARLKELRERQFKLLNQLIYHVALKANNLEAKQVGGLIRECTIARRKLKDDGTSEVVRVDGIDWRTGQPKSCFAPPNPHGRIAGVLLREPGSAPIKFDEPLEPWD